MNNLYDYFDKMIDANKLSHSFLIGNTNLDYIKDDLFKIISKYIFKKTADINNNPDLYIIKPEKNIISKESIKNLLNEISFTSQFSNNKVYIIDECEKLNDYSYNAILKTLEEPKDNIYAFLITTNIESIKPTIVSRCQKIFVSSEIDNNSFDDETVDIGNKMIDYIEKEGYKIIQKKPELYNIIKDRDKLNDILNYILKVYFESLNNLVYNIGEENIITKNNDIEKLSKKILIINNNINNLKYYLNKNLTIDRFVIEMWRC